MAAISDQNRGATLRTIVVLALCAVFFLLAMGITLLGSNIYRNVASAADRNYTHRTALSFVVNQLRRSDCGEIQVGTFDGQQALLLFSREGDPYATVLYCYDGHLRELYVEAVFLDEFGAADGLPIMELDSLTLTADGSLLTIVADGNTVTVSPKFPLREVGAL